MIDIAINGEGQKEKAHFSLLRILGVALLCALVVVGLCYIIIAPGSSYISVEVKGQQQISTDEILAIAGIRQDARWSDFNAAAAEKKLKYNPLFSQATVRKRFPDRVIVSVTERVPVAVAVGEFEGRSVPVEIDRDGVIFRVGAESNSRALPLITGINMANPVPGSSLNAQLKPLLRQLEELVTTSPRLLASVSEIKIDPKAYGSYDLILYPVHIAIPVRTNKALNADALQYMMLVLDVVDELRLDVREIDIRAGTVAYISGEADL